MQKNAPKILAVVLLVAIAALMLVAGGNDIIKLFNGINAASAGDDSDDTDNNINNDNFNNNNNQIPSGDDKNPDDKDDEEIKTPQIIQTAFPKAAKESFKYLYEQSVDVVGEISLNKVLYTSDAVFLVISSLCQSGDFSVAIATVSIIKMDFDGTLLKILHLEAPLKSEYLTSQITDMGLQVTITTSEKTYLFHVDTDLNVTKKIELLPSKKAKIFSLSSGYILILERQENTIYFVEDGEIIKTTLLSSGDTECIIETSEKLVFFVNGLNGYSVISMDKNLASYDTVIIPSKILLKLQPVTENGKLFYIAVEKKNGTVSLTKYSSSYRETGEDITLGRGDKVSTYLNGSSIFVILENENSSKIYLCDLALGISLAQNTFFNDINKVFLCHEYKDGYYILCATEAGYKLIDLRNDTTVSSKTIAEDPVDATFIRRYNGEIILFYAISGENNHNSIGIIAIEY